MRLKSIGVFLLCLCLAGCTFAGENKLPAVFSAYDIRSVDGLTLEGKGMDRSLVSLELKKAEVVMPRGMGRFLWPTPGVEELSSGYGWRNHPVLKMIRFHTGVDIPAGTGHSAVSIADGVVTYTGWLSGFGNSVIVKHEDGKESRYCHFSKITVQTGDRVRAGEEVGKVGSTGMSTGPHLHFEIHSEGKHTNPMDWY